MSSSGPEKLVSLRLAGAGPRASSAGCASPGPAVYLETYGCQMNVADSDLVLGLLGQAGYRRVERPEQAEVVILNTCAVRERAEERVLARANELASLKRRRPDLLLAVR